MSQSFETKAGFYFYVNGEAVLTIKAKTHVEVDNSGSNSDNDSLKDIYSEKQSWI